jgi:hypothetical protein
MRRLIHFPALIAAILVAPGVQAAPTGAQVAWHQMHQMQKRGVPPRVPLGAGRTRFRLANPAAQQARRNLRRGCYNALTREQGQTGTAAQGGSGPLTFPGHGSPGPVTSGGSKAGTPPPAVKDPARRIPGRRSGFARRLGLKLAAAVRSILGKIRTAVRRRSDGAGADAPPAPAGGYGIPASFFVGSVRLEQLQKLTPVSLYMLYRARIINDHEYGALQRARVQMAESGEAQKALPPQPVPRDGEEQPMQVPPTFLQ